MEFHQIEGFPNYLVTDTGEIYSKRLKRFIKKFPNKNVKYFCVNIWKNNKGYTFYVHRLVAKAFIPNPENKKEINHIDGNKQNNNIKNLEWYTRLENTEHAIKTGLRVYKNRLLREEFLVLLNRVLNGESYLQISQTVDYKVPFLSTKLRKIAKEEGLEKDLDEALRKQKLERLARRFHTN